MEHWQGNRIFSMVGTYPLGQPHGHAGWDNVSGRRSQLTSSDHHTDVKTVIAAEATIQGADWTPAGVYPEPGRRAGVTGVLCRNKVRLPWEHWQHYPANVAPYAAQLVEWVRNGFHVMPRK